MAVTEYAEPLVPEWSQGDRYRKSREHAQLTQDAMAERLSAELGYSVSKSTLSNWENDIGQPRHLDDVRAAWARITKVDEAWIAGFRTGSFATLEIVPDDGREHQNELPFPPSEPFLTPV